MSIQSVTASLPFQKTVLCALSAVVLVAVPACTNTPGDGGASCGSATINGDADANNTFTELTATQCDVALNAGDLTLSIDVLERTDGASSPRVLFTLPDLAEIPGDASISLARENDTDLAPAVYQEFTGPAPDDMNLADGPFWSSSVGTITFSTDEMGTITAEFDFTADNPRPDNPSTATGTVAVSGSIIVSELTGGSGCGACGPSGIAPMALILLGLSLAKFRVRRRR